MAPSPSFASTRLLKVCKRSHRFFRPRLSSKGYEPSPKPSRSQPPSNSLLGLPAEIKQLIFELLADIPSLRALLSTCSTLYCSFHDSESSILTGFLQRRIPPSLMHTALATLKSSEPAPWSKQTAEDLITLYTKTDKSSLLPELNLRNAHLLSETNDHVQFFANRFASVALSYHPVTCLPELVSTPISPRELCRIERTFYRFQFYCNLMAMRQKRRFSRRRPSIVISDGFAPWENEQMACIIDHLYNATKSVLENIRVHTVERTAISCFSDYWSESVTMKCLPLGLAFLRRLVHARTHEEGCRILFAQRLSREIFRNAWGVNTHYDQLPLSQMNEEEQREWIKPPAVYDHDGGPEAAWRWAHAEMCLLPWYDVMMYNHLREWGYVMWDYDRWDRFGVLGMDPNLLSRPWHNRFRVR